MLITGIKSKPVYAPLSADVTGRHHLMLGLGPGGAALLRVLGELQTAAPAALTATRVLLVPDSPAAIAQFAGIGIAAPARFDGPGPLLEAFTAALEESLMGTRLYVAGPESFIGRAMQVALRFNLNKDEIRAEECGTLARRVRCVHCRTTTEEVRTNIVRCFGCDRWLLVRDHYSKRLAAYMGIMVDAEAPGELPPIREIYL
jgi:hypothetical protein